LQEEAEMSKYVAKHLSQQSVWGGDASRAVAR